MDETNTVVPVPEIVTLESAEHIIDFWQQRAEAAEAEAAGLRERLTDLQTAVEERDTELTMLREALDTIPLYEYGDAQREGCDPGGAWDCFKEALEEHISAVRSAPAVYDAKNDIADLRQQLATVTALVPEAELMERAAVMAWHHCESCPVENNGCRGRKREDWTCKMLQAQLRNLAARIHAWRGDGRTWSEMPEQEPQP